MRGDLEAKCGVSRSIICCGADPKRGLQNKHLGADILTCSSTNWVELVFRKRLQ